MLKVLIVEDNHSKVQKITNVIISCGIEINRVTHVSSKLAALVEVKKNSFDVLLLDMMIPGRLDEESDPDGGIDLLSEITDRNNYIAPQYVIAITQFSELFEKNSEQFLNRNFSSIYYDETESNWKTQLIERIGQIILARSSYSQQVEYKSFATIICALESIELDSVLHNGWIWARIDIANDDTVYYKTILYDANKHPKHIYAAACARMGMPAASTLAMKLIHHFQPEYLIMNGIMAALRGKANYGDVIIPDLLWDYGSGKVVIQGDNKDSIFLNEPYQVHLSTSLKSIASRIKTNEQFLFTIKRDFRFTKPPESLSIHVGPVASGSAVLADGTSIKKVQEQHRKLIGIEMEAYAVFLAAQESFYPKPNPICIKSVVDFADENKDDRFHNYAAYTSAAIMKEIVENYLIN